MTLFLRLNHYVSCHQKKDEEIVEEQKRGCQTRRGAEKTLMPN
jgi:hypothetical protein